MLPRQISLTYIVTSASKSITDLHLLVADVGQVAAVGGLGRVLRVDVEVLEHDGLAERRLVVDPRAALAVAAGADLEVEGAVDLVLLGAEDGGQVLRHPELEPEPLPLPLFGKRKLMKLSFRFSGNICDQSLRKEYNTNRKKNVQIYQVVLNAKCFKFQTKNVILYKFRLFKDKIILTWVVTNFDDPLTQVKN